MTTEELEMIKSLSENQSTMLNHIKDLQKENIEIKAQLAEKTPDEKKKPDVAEPTEAELDAVFAGLRV